MKRIILLLSVLAVVGALAAPAAAVDTSASCAILMDADSGRILYEENIHQSRSIASITKLMTALVAVERTNDLDEPILIRPEWLGSEGTSIYLTAGEKLTMRDLLYGLLLESGNDAAMAVACHVAGNVSAFAKLMNEKAEELGMSNSRFANPSGLSDENHYSTAYDMALLACACLKNEFVAEICATQSYTAGTRTFYNHNKLLSRYEGCIGMKTGYTELAGRTLISAAVRNGQTLVCVTLNDRDDWNDHEKLLNYGFETYPLKTICRAGDAVGMVKVTGSLLPALPVVTSEDIAYPLAYFETPEQKIEFVPVLQAPVSAGAPVGKIVWTVNGNVIGQTNLVCASDAHNDLCQRGRRGEWLARRFGLWDTAVG